MSLNSLSFWTLACSDVFVSFGKRRGACPKSNAPGEPIRPGKAVSRDTGSMIKDENSVNGKGQERR
jgi:hypothetical protein